MLISWNEVRHQNLYLSKDKFDNELHDGDFVDVQKDGVQKIYTKEDG